MKLLFALVSPWFLFFITAIALMATLGLQSLNLGVPLWIAKYGILIIGTGLCLMSNLRSLGAAGIWLSESLPESLRYGSWRWILRAMKALLIAGAFWVVGQLPWTPLVWQGAVLPLALTICLFVGLVSLLGSILRWSTNVPWSRAVAFVVSLPLLALVPLTAFYLERTMVFAYRASHADPTFAIEEPIGPARGTANVAGDSATKTAATDAVPEKLLEEKELAVALKSRDAAVRAQAFRALALKPALCAEHTREIQSALDPKGNKEVVLAAVKAVSCGEVRSVIAMPRLVSIMNEHGDPATRAAAIRAMKRYGQESLKQVAYLLVKRLNDREAPEVIEATAEVMASLGPEQQRYATNRLKSLLDVDATSQAAARSLAKSYHREDLVTEYVSTNLAAPGEGRARAIGLICQLPKQSRAIAEPHITTIVGLVKTADANDRGLNALRCLGSAGFKAIRDELTTPQRLDRLVAARAFAELDVKDAKAAPEALETANACVRDDNAQIRALCSQSLGKLGAPALPKILELLKSGDSSLKSAGQNALLHFEDPNAKGELHKVLSQNTGWMADQRKLQVAKAIGTALAKIERNEETEAAPTTTTEPALARDKAVE